MSTLNKNKEIGKPWTSGCNSFTMVIPRSFVIKHQLDTSTHVLIEETPEGILIKKLEM
jgi:hypothetical protein